MGVRRFIVTREDGPFVLGRFEGESNSGVYLNAEYVRRLAEVRGAVVVRLEAQTAEPSDALKNLLGILGVLVATHGEQLNAENAPALAEVERALEAIGKDLGSLGYPPIDPSNNDT